MYVTCCATQPCNDLLLPLPPPPAARDAARLPARLLMTAPAARRGPALTGARLGLAVGRQPKVAQLEAPGPVQQAVGGLDVAVDQLRAARVQVRQRPGEVAGQLDGPARSQFAGAGAAVVSGGVWGCANLC
jgi:hypothetical protein